MITKVNIQNFQSHKNTTLDFHPGVNVIIGSSDSGKSAIIRSLRWAAYGKPRGDAFRSHWGGDTRVTIYLPKGIVSRVRSNSENKYTLQNPKQIEFKASGVEVPEEIVNFFDWNELNLQQQADTPFLISNTPGEVAAHFNKMANLEKIDECLKTINSDIHSLDTDVKYKKEALAKAQEDLKTYHWLKEASERVEGISEKEEKKETQKTLLNSLNSILAGIYSIEDKIAAKNHIKSGESAVNTLLSKHDNLQQRKNLLISLKFIASKIQGIDNRVERMEALISGESGVDSLLSKLQTLEESRLKYSRLRSLFRSVRNIEAQIFSETQTAKAHEQVEYLLKIMKIHADYRKSYQSLSSYVSKLQELDNRIASGEKFLETMEDAWKEIGEEECPLCGNQIQQIKKV